jgi:hypothetical protein
MIDGAMSTYFGYRVVESSMVREGQLVWCEFNRSITVPLGWVRRTFPWLFPDDCPFPRFVLFPRLAQLGRVFGHLRRKP